MRRPMMIPTTIARARARARRRRRDDARMTTTTTRAEDEGEDGARDVDASDALVEGVREMRVRDDANEEAGFWGRISWLHLFFLGLFVLPTAFALLDYFFAFTPPPGQGYGSLTPEARMIREKIKAFYSEYNPEKLRTVDELMIKYKGRERALYNTIKKKYRRSGAKRVDQRFDE